MNAVLDTAAGTSATATLSTSIREQLIDAIRMKESPWADVKKFGKLAFKGQAAVAAKRLLSSLDDLSMVTVRVGELEGFAPALGVRKGKEWLAAAIEAGAHTQPPARAHVTRLLSTKGTVTF